MNITRQAASCGPRLDKAIQVATCCRDSRSSLLWMDKIHFAPLGSHGKPLIVGIHKKIIIPSFLKWCRMSCIHSITMYYNSAHLPILIHTDSCNFKCYTCKVFTTPHPTQPLGLTYTVIRVEGGLSETTTGAPPESKHRSPRSSAEGGTSR